MKSKRSKACDIPPKVKARVRERDEGKCVLCKLCEGFPNAHYISRAQGGLGVEENVVSLCLDCHGKLDGAERNELKPKVKAYLQSKYPNWNEEDLIYSKWRN